MIDNSFPRYDVVNSTFEPAYMIEQIYDYSLIGSEIVTMKDCFER